MNAIRMRVLAILLVVALGMSIGVAYLAVVSQNPHPPASALYGPGDFAQH